MATLSIKELWLKAVARRQALLDEDTNAIRLFDGRGDGWDGVQVDSYADRLLVSSTERTLPADWVEVLKKTEQTVYFKYLDESKKSEAPRWIAGRRQEEPFAIRENGVCFEVSFQAGYSQGIFLDQRGNRGRIMQTIKRGQTLLNAFAYTGGFSVVAGLRGAVTTTLDLSQTYLDWAKRNFELNGLKTDEHFFCKGDTRHWLKRFARQGRRFDMIVLDPPTFSRDDRGRIFRVERDYGELARLSTRCLTRAGKLLCSTNCRRFSLVEFQTAILAEVDAGTQVSTLPMPEEYREEPYLKTIEVESSLCNTR